MAGFILPGASLLADALDAVPAFEAMADEDGAVDWFIGILADERWWWEGERELCLERVGGIAPLLTWAAGVRCAAAVMLRQMPLSRAVVGDRTNAKVAGRLTGGAKARRRRKGREGGCAGVIQATRHLARHEGVERASAAEPKVGQERPGSAHQVATSSAPSADSDEKRS